MQSVSFLLTSQHFSTDYYLYVCNVEIHILLQVIHLYTFDLLQFKTLNLTQIGDKTDKQKQTEIKITEV